MASAAESGPTEKQDPCAPAGGGAGSTEIAASRSLRVSNQSVNRCSMRGSLRAGRVAPASPTRKQFTDPLVVQSNRPALVCATATSAVPPSAPPGITTSHEPSAAIVTLTVRAGRPGFCRLYVATNRLSRAAATRAASCPQGAVGAVGTAVADGVSSG